jgi:hypothetical protein
MAHIEYAMPGTLNAKENAKELPRHGQFVGDIKPLFMLKAPKLGDTSSIRHRSGPRPNYGRECALTLF